MNNSFVICLFVPILAFSQYKTETYFYDEDGRKVDSALAKTISYHIYYDTIKGSGIIRSTSFDGKIRYVTEYSNLKDRKSILTSKSYFENGQLKSFENYSDGVRNGELTSYYSSGQLKRKDYFKKGKFIKGNCFSSTGQDTAHFDFERMPQFPGGESNQMKFISENIKYPSKSKEKGIEGTVVVKFIIDKTGFITDIKILRSVDPSLDEEVIRVIKRMPKWSPGLQEGEIMPIPFTLPIRFKLE